MSTEARIIKQLQYAAEMDKKRAITATHTPTPWARGNGAADSIFAGKGGDRHRIATCYTENSYMEKHLTESAEDFANAAFIVQAVNCHDELLAVLELAVEIIKPMPGQITLWADELEQMYAAINKAKDVTP
jgi:hypothetical protein